ncbi:L-lysine 6-monooxygenase/L-ornithine 5-monooxygenase [Penicillium lagena]|uniref:L-lysine 6-monooxygenase/L-ornithine 5-monooxygenase n=1 Tax=Penicillium lagena TaxID=94218 RepID=UPI0025418117|nr:L-lysine 6-monooxygenase/L-ornithine 5-monooxygenase [Penicillium lagena]KAJ5601549.1 L-lysine 6-monooxygenase/L-ornithine 5-monooxygenase [Penicillium lagena]
MSTNANHPDSEIQDVIIIGAGPCGLAVAARLQEETPSAMFTDEEHQRYHWIKKHSGRMSLVQGRKSKINGVQAEKWNGGHLPARKNSRARRESSESASSVPSLSSVSSSTVTESISTLVIDGSGDEWMHRWSNLFRALEIKQLRSPMFFHVDPGDRDGMLAYTQEVGREHDLWEIPGCVGKEMSKHKKKKRRQGGRSQTISGVEIDERDRKDYFSPSTNLFFDYNSSIIERYGLDKPGQILRREVTELEYDYLPEKADVPVSNSKIFTITTSTGEKFFSKAVVLAIGAGGADVAKIFPWRPSSEEEGANACCHSMEIRSFPENLRTKIQRQQETNILVVGGGLSSAQIVDMAVRRGVTKVWLLMRSELKGE